MATPRSPRQGGLRTASPSSLHSSHRRHATPERGRRPRRSGRQLPDATPPSILAPSAILDASERTRRHAPGDRGSLKVRVAHLWHTRVRNAGQQGLPVSSNQARNGLFWALHAGSCRTHNPSAVGSSPTCPTGVSAGHRLAIRPGPPEVIAEQGHVAHLWHIRNLNPPVVVRAGPAPLTSAQVKRPGSRPGPFGARACGTSVAHVRVASTGHPNGDRSQFGRTQAASQGIPRRTRTQIAGL